MDYNFTPIILPGRASQRHKTVTPVMPDQRAKLQGRDYADRFVQLENQSYMTAECGTMLDEFGNVKSSKAESLHRNVGPMSDVDSVTTGYTGVGELDDRLNVYTKYNFNPNPVKRLSIEKYKSKILQAVDSQRVVILTGATGCGKSTQVPQYILDSFYAKGMYCNIVVTQPRRLAAITVCNRVAKERNETVGQLIGYQIGQEKKVHSQDTRLLFCTTGVLLNKLIANNTESEFTHYILDEVHERDQDMDFLLLVMRRLINTKFSNAKLIIMSATVNVDPFCQYLYTYSNKTKILPRHLNLSDERNFDVKVYYLDDLKRKIVEAQALPTRPQKPEISSKAYLVAYRLIRAFDIVDEQERDKGAVLIFLPGLFEIEEMHKFLNLEFTKYNQEMGRVDSSEKIMALHSSVTYEEQKRVFNRMDPKTRKIILSTNIAESSITVPDIRYVIDFCLTKILCTDKETSFTTLIHAWASKSSLEQRAGRVGRVSDGRVYRLVYKEFYQSLDKDTQPEILRCPLDRLVLQAKLLNMGSPKEILALAMDQPDLGSIQQAVETLKEIGALKIMTTDEKTKDLCFDECDGDLSYMGKVIASLPLDVRLAKLVFLGHIFGVQDETVIMACSMATKTVFSTPFKEYQKAYNSRLSWADSTCSDCIAFMSVYLTWRNLKSSGKFRGGAENSENKWAKDEFVQLNVLCEIAILEAEVKHRLRRHNLAVSKAPNYDPVVKALCLKLAIAGAFYPNYFLRSANTIDEERNAVNEVGGNDPFSTVCLTGMPPNQPPLLYKGSIRAQFKDVSPLVDVVFDRGPKVYVKFGRTTGNQLDKSGRNATIPGRIEMAVYRAVKMRQWLPKGVIKIPVLNPVEAAERYEQYMKHKGNVIPTNPCTEWLAKMSWPWNRDAKIRTDMLNVTISHVDSPSQFWIIDSRKEATDLQESIISLLYPKENLYKKKVTDELDAAKIYAMEYTDHDNCTAMYRCKIISKDKDRDNLYKYSVRFIDFGNTVKNIHANMIYEIRPDVMKSNPILSLPNFAFECCLAKLQPYELIWTASDIEYMRRQFELKKTTLKVYSMVGDLLAVKVLRPEHAKKRYDRKNTINYYLTSEYFARRTEELYLSALDHDVRKRNLKKIRRGENVDDINPGKSLQVNREFEDIDPPPREECRHEVILKGPYSPLEMTVTSATRSTQGKFIKIEKDSVNSVLLDNDPSARHERMLVAAFVGVNSEGNRLNLRHTTIMPSLPGLPAIATMLFAPMVELRSDPQNTKFCGALCGLGFNECTGTPIYPENDVEVIFDVKFTLQHIELINQIRFMMNLVVCRDEDYENPEDANPVGLVESIVSEFEPQSVFHNPDAYTWKLIPKKLLMAPCENTCTTPWSDFSGVYRLIWGIGIDQEYMIDAHLIEKNIADVQSLADGQRDRRGGVECKLCVVLLQNCLNARLHISSMQHKLHLAFFEKKKKEHSKCFN